ncbi:SGNH/GDSL hydrolase family protein [Tropicimonas sp. TH_r6]|uniref:SGNH/GDSL hydrolase family protein n=1 Tax=Tropicimonas sp. TH_r6 TaxID=3082085 RepID=UPI002953AC6F|nr:SGNH/GDSL hydrolase family protein [Tropicimonas sp. TH_r6]MDV7145541.1 SGNH/GDSL hydrolase family protein [Tropicimonas sp. TH_r6]
MIHYSLVAIPVLLVAGGLWWAHPKGADIPFPEMPRPTPVLPAGEGPITLAVLGTSLTANTAWPEEVTAGLEACADRPVRLRRFAAGGQTSAWGLDQVAAVIDAAPNIVLVEFTINDADIRRQIGLSESARNHREIVERLQSALPGAAVVLLRLNRAHGLRALSRPRLSAYENALVPLAETTGTGLVDLRSAWATALKTDMVPNALPDGLHPTDAAVQAIVTPKLATELCILVQSDDV